MRELTLGVRQNQQEVGDFLKDLDSWTTDIKKQDQNLKTMKPREQVIPSMPPVRTKHITEKVKNKRKAEKEKTKKERIKSADYRKWEKLDIDQMCKEIDEEEEEAETELQVEIDKLDQKRKEKVAIEMKQKGNEHFKNKGYEAAIECYTTGMQADPSNPIFPANRAMAYLKLKKYSEAETDCTLTLSLDPAFTKAYLRRGTARVALGKTTSARKDFMDALKIEPNNPQAKSELKKIDHMEKSPAELKATTQKKNTSNKSSYVYPILIPVKDRSKKPLMRVEVEEIGFEGVENENLINNGHNSIASNIADELLDSRNKPYNTTKETVALPKENSKNLIEELKPASDCLNDNVDKTRLPTKIESSENIDTAPKAKILTNGHSLCPAQMKSPQIPSCPTTSFQFQAHVKALGNNLSELYTYLLQITPESIPSLLKQQLETETLVSVMKCLQTSTDFCLVYEYVRQFSRVRRFDMAIMFMSEGEKQEVKSLFTRLKDSLPEQISELDRLVKLYGLKF